MKAIINGKSKEIPDTVTVAELLEWERVDMPQYVSVQLNQEFVRRENFNQTRLSEGDRVDFLYFMGGGSEAAPAELTPEQVERYSRQIILEEVGLAGQLKLLESRVLLVGAGGLGSPAAYYLAAAGVGKIGLVDFDRVELNNLQRQILFNSEDAGRLKAEAAAERLAALNPELQITPYPYRLSADNALSVLQDYDFVIDATDGFANKFLVNDACFFAGKPFIHAGILRFEGQAITVLPAKTACYRCLFPTPPPPGAVPSCAQAGILGVLAGFFGIIQAAEALKYLLGKGELLTNRMLYFNALELKFHQVDISRSPSCPLCGENPTITELSEEHVVCSSAGDADNHENI